MSGIANHKLEGIESVIYEATNLKESIPPWEDAKSLQKQGKKRFDVNEYFKILKHISVAPGFEVDYFYEGWDLFSTSAAPQLYARRQGDPTLECTPEEPTKEEQENRFGSWTPLPISSVLIPDKTPQGWFELLIFYRYAPQFYLEWHALYDKFVFVGSLEHLIDLIPPLEPSEDEKFYAALDLETDVLVDDKSNPDYVLVTYTGFMEWKGFKRIEEKISRRYPYISISQRELSKVACPSQSGFL